MKAEQKILHLFVTESKLGKGNNYYACRACRGYKQSAGIFKNFTAGFQ